MKIPFSLIFCIVLLASGCSQYSRIQKGNDMDAKLDLAVKLYEKGEYYKALPLFEELIVVFRGTKKAEKTYYHYAYTNYRLGDFETAAYDFQNFTKTYPTSEYAEECAFMHAYCFYQMSPEYSLDQTSTLKAINQLQLFADRHPYSARLDQCNKLIDQLRGKLELKAFENAELYFNMDSYKAAITSYKLLLKEYPSTNFREEVMFKILRASFLLAENSVEEKKSERYNETVMAYTNFISSFPDSRLKNKAADIFNATQKRLDKINLKLVQQEN